MSSTQTETVTETVSPLAKFSTPKDLVDFSGMTFGDWRDEFHKNGCVVLKGVIPPEKAQYYSDTINEFAKCVAKTPRAKSINGILKSFTACPMRTKASKEPDLACP